MSSFFAIKLDMPQAQFSSETDITKQQALAERFPGTSLLGFRLLAQLRGQARDGQPSGTSLRVFPSYRGTFSALELKEPFTSPFAPLPVGFVIEANEVTDAEYSYEYWE
jgi:hypothetical protein